MAILKPKRTFIRTRLIRRGFRASQTISAAALESLLEAGESELRIVIPPLSTTQALQLQIWFGPDEAPQDGDTMEYFLAFVDVDNLSDVNALRQTCEWQAFQRWEYIQNTGVGATVLDAVSQAIAVVQTMQHENLVFITAPKDNIELADRLRESAWILLAFAGPNEQVVRVQGTFSCRIDLIQRVWGNDAYTWNKDPDDVNRDGVSEIDMDISDGSN